MKPYIITIARQYGSGGKTVGKMLAERLGIPFYNREIITMASEDSGVNAMLFSDERLKSDFIARLHARYRGDIPVPNDSSKSYLRDEALFSYQVKIIERLADQGPCVLIGRCADYILRNRPDVVRVFVHADPEFCVEQAMKGRFSPRKRGQKEDQRDRRLPCALLQAPHGPRLVRCEETMTSRSTAACSALRAWSEEIVRYMEVRSEFCK